MRRGPLRWLTTLRGGRLVVAVVVALGILIAFGRLFASAYVEVLWQNQAGYADVFWRRVAWEWGVRALAGVLVGVLMFTNLKLAARTLGGIHIRRRFANIEIAERVPGRVVWWAIFVAAALLGLWFGAAVPANLGIQALVLLKAGSWGVVEPVLGHDVSFYVFWVPLLGGALNLGLIATFLVFTLVTAGYAATGTIRWSRGRVDAQDLPRVHLGGLLAAFLVLMALRLWLQRYLLLLDGNSPVQGIFGYADAQARLPALQTLSVICVGAAAGTFFGAWKNRAGPVLASLGAVVVGSIVIGQLYPSLIQRVRVQPNELNAETPYIEDNLEFTRLGFGLDELDRRSFRYLSSESVDWDDAERQFAGLPVWSQSALLTTYRQLEARFPYYDFSDVTIDRYPGPSGAPVPVAVSARQIEPTGIQDPNWQNQHLRKRYVAGMGIVASLAVARTPEGRPEMLITGIPPGVAPGEPEIPTLRLDRPEIFFGTRQQRYAVVNPETEAYLAPDSTPGVPGVDFPLGIELRSGLRTALLAWHFGDANLIFASELTHTSRFIYRRQAVDRALAIAPFLRFPEQAYAVVADGRVFWVLEGFTGTGAFPLSTAADFGTVRRGVRYVRNSVKVTVDAVTGHVDFYRVPIEDPLADAYEAAFPGLFHAMDEMPSGIRDHLRYPRALLSLQSRVLLQYHQETAPAFHGQQDVWSEPQELAQATSPVPYRPEYGALPAAGRAGAALPARDRVRAGGASEPHRDPGGSGGLGGRPRPGAARRAGRGPGPGSPPGRGAGGAGPRDLAAVLAVAHGRKRGVDGAPASGARRRPDRLHGAGLPGRRRRRDSRAQALRGERRKARGDDGQPRRRGPATRGCGRHRGGGARNGPDAGRGGAHADGRLAPIRPRPAGPGGRARPAGGLAGVR